MRIRSTLVAIVAFVASLAGTSAPAHATTAADVHMQISFGCYGCGTYGPAGNSVAWWCYGVCIIDGHVCAGACHYYGNGTVNSGTGIGCVVSSTMSGTITFPTGVWNYTLSMTLGTWSMTFTKSGSPTMTGAGTYTFSSASVPPCGAAVTATFVGVMS